PSRARLFPYTSLFRSGSARRVGVRGRASDVAFARPELEVESARECGTRSGRRLDDAHRASGHDLQASQTLECGKALHLRVANAEDRKSTRLNSSHVKI